MNGLKKLLPVILVLMAGPVLAGPLNQSSVGLMLGDPIALTMKLPTTDQTFLNAKAGVWTWRLWEQPIKYDTPFFSVDLARFLGSETSRHGWYVGAGVAVFFQDNPKDDDDSDTVAAARLPVGFQFHNRESFSMCFEVAVVHQFAPWYVAKPYWIELNGGLVLQYAF